MRNLRGAYARVARANEHIDDLKSRQVRLAETNEGKFRFHLTETHAVQIIGGEDIISDDPKVSILVGEIAYNLRAALDYLIYELAALDSNSLQANTQFPVCQNAADFKKERKTRLRGVSDVHAAAIEKLQPYNGCIWTDVLCQVSNPDKHKELTVVAGAMEGWMKIYVGTPEEIERFKRDDTTIPTQLARGAEVCMDADEDLHAEGNFSVLIMFGAQLPAIATFDDLSVKIANLLDVFAPEF